MEWWKKAPTSVIYIQPTIPQRPSLVGSPPTVAEISWWNVPPGSADISLAPMARKPMTSSTPARSRWILADAILTWVSCAWQADDRILCGAFVRR